MDRTPKPLNPEALKIARELLTIKGAAEVVAQVAIDHLAIKKEIGDELRVKAAEMREIAKNGEKRIDALREDGLKRVAEVEKQHEDVMNRLRDAQPELHRFEFRLDLEAGTYTPEAGRELDAESNSTPEKSAPDAQNDNIRAMVDGLLSKFMTKSDP